MINYIFGQLLCQLHLKDRLAMQRFISGLLLSTWALSSPFSASSLNTTHKLDNSSSGSSSTSGLLNDLITPLDRSEHLSDFHKLTHTWANLLNEISSMSSTSSTSSPILLSSRSSDLSMFKNLSNLIPIDIQNDLQNITKQLHGKLESCLTEVIYYEEILAPFKLMQEDCRELIRSMKICGLSVDPQIPVNGVLTIAHCKALLQTVANTIQHMENASSTSSNIGGIDASLLDRLNCQFERTRTTVDHCLTLQLYLGNRVELGIACAFANMNWILPGRLSLLIRPLMDTIRCMKPSVSTVSMNTNSTSTSPTTTAGVLHPSTGIISNSTTSNNNNPSSTGVGNNTGNACIDILPIGTCVHLQRLAACCLARLMWLEWRMLLNAAKSTTSTTSSSSTMSKINERFSHMMMNTSKAAAKVIKNLTSYLIESDPELLLSSVQNSNSKQSETNNQFHEDQLLDDVKMVCTDQIPTGRLVDMDSVTTSTTLSSYESQCQSAQYRGAYIALSCICYTFITFYHCEEINEAHYQVANMSSSSSLSSSKEAVKPLNSLNSCQLTNNSLNSLRFGLPTLWNIFWLNPIKIIIDVYRPHIAVVGGVRSIENGKIIKKRNNENDKCKVKLEEEEKQQQEEEESHYSLLKRLTHEVKLTTASSMNANSLSKSAENELLTGLTLLSTCLNVILPCIDPDRKTVNQEEDSSPLRCCNDDISFEQIVWLGSLVIRLPYPACRRIGARLLADLTLLQPVHTLNILLPILLSLPSSGSSSSNDGSFLMSDLSTICIGALETFLTIVDKFTNIQNTSAHIFHKNPPVVLNDPLLEPDSKSSCSPLSLSSSTSISTNESFSSTEKHAPLISESKTADRLTGDTIKDAPTPTATTNSNPMESATSSSSLPDNLKLFLPYLVLLLTPTLKLISSANQEIRSVAGKLFTALLNLLPLEASIPNPVNMKEEFKRVRGEQREFIDSLLHPNRIQMYNLPIKINATLRSYQQEGVNWLCFLNRYGLNGILCDDLGLGKTLQTICILAGSHHELKQSLLSKKTKQSKSNKEENASSMKKLKSTTDKKKKKPSKSMPTSSMKKELDESNQSPVTMNDELSNKELGLPLSLVICPSTLCGHWSHEIQHYAQTDDLKPLIYAGNPAVRQSLLSKFHQYDVIITSYDSVRSDIEYFQSINWNYVILDEGHIIKSSKSKVTRAVKQLIAQHRLILTGTPIQNRVSELWSLFDFLMPEFLGTEQHFLAKFARPVAVSRDVKASKADQRAGQLALEKLHRLVLPFMLRRLKEDVMQDLPPKIIQDFACKMTPIQRKLYESFQKTDEGKQLMNIVGSTSASASSHSANATTATGKQQSTYISSVVVSHGFQAVRYFQAVCNHPCLVLKSGHPMLDEIKWEFGIQSTDQLRSIHLSGKLLALCRLLTDCGFGSPNLSNNMPGTSSSSNGNNSSLTSSGSSTSLANIASASNDFYANRSLLSQHRALIFFQTREMLQLTADMLRELFPWITATRLDGSIPVGERHNRVVRFNQDPSIDIMLLTTAVGGLGLNLTGADTVIFVEHDWNPCKDLQAMDRAHRIGQSRTVNVYRLITEDSIEEQIMNLQAFKLHLANTILTTDNKNINEMDTEHLFDRLSSYSNNNNNNSNEEEVQHSRDNHHQYDNGQSGFALLDELETCYEVEYNLDAFIARLKTN
ncbi:unnamed protein product [Trichobilharzia szidati]|nr:unnamed protein product [Trichobilharzia szidati]